MGKSWPRAFLSLAAGIILGYYQAWLVTFSVILVLIISGALLKQYSRQIFIGLLILLGGLLYADKSIKDMPASLPVIQGASCSGTVQDFPFIDGDKTTFIMKTDSSSCWEKKIRVVCYFKTDIARGDRIDIRGTMKPPRPPGNPGEFNYSLYLSHSGIYYNLSVKNEQDLHLLSHEQGLLKWIDGFRARGEKIAKDTLPDQEAAILLGMLLGTREGIDEDQYDAFQKTGIIHLLSVSGLHVGFLLLLIAWISLLLRLSRRDKFLSGVAVLIIYGTMVAWPVCVMRSILMGILGLLAYYSGRANSIFNAMAIAGIITLLVNPASLFTISFQFTFLATWGLVYIFPQLREILPVKGWGWDMLWLPLAAELAVLPLTAYYFNILTPASILTNILVSYLSCLAVILGFIAFFMATFIPFLAPMVLYPAGLFIELILWIVGWVKSLPGAYIWVATPPVWSLLLYYVALLIGLTAWRNRACQPWRYPALAMLAVFFVILLLPAGFYNRGYLELDFIDVGQGDAILLKTPRGKFMLIDGGGNSFYDVGRTTLLPYLHRRGIRELILAVNTHPDNDHLQGIETVAEEIPVGNIALPASLVNCPEYRPLREIATLNRIPILTLTSGQEIKLEKGLRIKVLHPGGQDSVDNSNNQSAVLRISYGVFSALLTGDIEAEAMQLLLENRQLAATTLVKVPHHGSKGSLLAEFYRQVQPHYAIISVGSNNLFGHPHPSVLDMLKKQDIKTLRTDQDGAIIVLSDGKKMIIKPTL